MATTIIAPAIAPDRDGRLVAVVCPACKRPQPCGCMQGPPLATPDTVVVAGPRRFTATDPDGAVLTLTARHELHRLQVARYGSEAVDLTDSALDALAEHVLHRGHLTDALDRHIQALRTLAIRHGGGPPHVLAAIEHLVDARRELVAVPAPATGQRVA